MIQVFRNLTTSLPTTSEYKYFYLTKTEYNKISQYYLFALKIKILVLTIIELNIVIQVVILILLLKKSLIDVLLDT